MLQLKAATGVVDSQITDNAENITLPDVRELTTPVVRHCGQRPLLKTGGELSFIYQMAGRFIYFGACSQLYYTFCLLCP